MRVLALVLLLGTLPAAAQTVRIYVTNSAGDSIHVIDPATQKVVQTIGPIEAAHGIDFSPDGKRVYVSNEADSTLDVFDRPSGKRIAKVKLSGHPNNIATTKDGGRVVVGIADDPGALDVIDTTELSVAKTIPVNGRLHNVYVTQDSKYVITGSIPNKVITVIDLDKETITHVDLQKKTYTVMTFDQIRQQMENAKREMEKKQAEHPAPATASVARRRAALSLIIGPSP